MSTLARLFEPPRLRTVEDVDEERHSTWLELFFDLVFVVAVAELGHNLSDDPTARGFGEFVALFVPVWWAWAGFTFYANRFDTDDLTYRLLCLLGMFAVAALATTIHGAFDHGGRDFTLAYVAVRLVIIALYVRAVRYVDRGRGLALWYATIFSTAVVVWLASLLVPTPARYALWVVALALELGAPLVGWRLLPDAPIQVSHLPERFGLLTIIVLGESVIAVVLGVAGVSWELSSGLAAFGGFVAAAALWWIYFDFLDESVVARGLLPGMVFTYAHFPVVAGLAALGVGVQLAVLSAGGEAQYDGTGWLVCAALALCMAGQAAIHLATPPRLVDVDVVLRAGTAVLALVLLPFAGRLSPELDVWILAVVLVAQVVYELVRHEEHTAGAPAPQRPMS